MRIARLLVATLMLSTLSGCYITRVSETRHDRDVTRMNAEGHTLDEARLAAERAGFVCESSIRRSYPVRIDGVDRQADILECNKKSFEWFCPQRRYASFMADPATQIVFNVGRRIVERSCF